MARVRAERGFDANLRAGPQMFEYEAIADRIARDRPERVLDWGCGWGQVAHLMKLRGLDVRAFDYRPDVAEPGLYPLERYPDIEAWMGEDLPYEDGEFDAVLSCGVLEHVHDPDASMADIRRILRPGGRFYVYKLPNRFSYLEWVARRAGLYYHGMEPDDRIYDRRSAEALMRRHGFEVREFRRANMLPLTTGGARGVWVANRWLGRAPVLNLLSTNLELLAVRQG